MVKSKKMGYTQNERSAGETETNTTLHMKNLNEREHLKDVVVESNITLIRVLKQ
jgi:hypothetical protein